MASPSMGLVCRAVVFAVAGVAASSTAQAFARNVSFCNRTTADVDVAIGADFAGTADTTSRGWYRVRGCTCRSILNAELRATEVFLFARRGSFDNVLQGGRAPLCVHPTRAFSFLAENAGAPSCTRAGGRWVTFKWHDTGTSTNYRLNLRRGGECNLMGDH